MWSMQTLRFSPYWSRISALYYRLCVARHVMRDVVLLCFLSP